MSRIIFFLFVISTFPLSVYSQNANEIEAYDTYIQFLNESVHGLFTAHALMVISNKEVNRYIDLDSYIINNISNDEVQTNLFDKSDKANYTTFHTYSPLELQVISKEKSQALPGNVANKLNQQVDNIVSILNRINSIRIVLDDFIEQHDLNEKESIYGIFEHMEEGVSLFNNYQKAHAKLANEIDMLKFNDSSTLYQDAKTIHETVQTILRNMRQENDTYVSHNINILESTFNNFNNTVQSMGLGNSSTYNNNIKVKIEKIIGLVKNFINPGNVPVEHELYGKHYYYHNEITKRYFNWAGPGFVRHLNSLLKEQNIAFVNFVEEPLIFKVVYPMKRDEIDELNEEKEQLEERNANINTDRMRVTPSIPNQEKEDIPAPVNSNIVTLEIYDHNMFDRDSISLSFNGVLKLDNYLITPQKKIIEIELDDNASNTLEVEAENWGIRAPNTFAIAYRFKGQRKKHYAEYNLNKDEKVTIHLNK